MPIDDILAGSHYFVQVESPLFDGLSPAKIAWNHNLLDSAAVHGLDILSDRIDRERGGYYYCPYSSAVIDLLLFQHRTKLS